jgi:hypothetical protein
LWEPFHSAAKGSLHLRDKFRLDVHGNHRAFVKIDHQASGSSELIKELAHALRSSKPRTKDDKCVVRVL